MKTRTVPQTRDLIDSPESHLTRLRRNTLEFVHPRRVHIGDVFLVPQHRTWFRCTGVTPSSDSNDWLVWYDRPLEDGTITTGLLIVEEDEWVIRKERAAQRSAA